MTLPLMLSLNLTPYVEIQVIDWAPSPTSALVVRIMRLRAHRRLRNTLQPPPPPLPAAPARVIGTCWVRSK